MDRIHPNEDGIERQQFVADRVREGFVVDDRTSSMPTASSASKRTKRLFYGVASRRAAASPPTNVSIRA
jgi:hypothetical protein